MSVYHCQKILELHSGICFYKKWMPCTGHYSWHARKTMNYSGSSVCVMTFWSLISACQNTCKDRNIWSMCCYFNINKSTKCAMTELQTSIFMSCLVKKLVQNLHTTENLFPLWLFWNITIRYFFKRILLRQENNLLCNLFLIRKKFVS